MRTIDETQNPCIAEGLTVQERHVLAIHRWGWPTGYWTYPRSRDVAIRQHIPWDQELVGRTYYDTPCHMARFYREVFGWNPPPYNVLVGAGGSIHQFSPMLTRTPHALVWNQSACSIAAVGNFNAMEPPWSTWIVCASLAASVCNRFGWDPEEKVILRGVEVHRVSGHDELIGGSSNQNKRCPGTMWNMDEFREQVASSIRAGIDLPDLL